jgi:flagellar hook-length control protein FliK
MNNTSAYANVLLKSPALKTAAAIPAAVTPKHDYVSDDASANFRQTFKDVHENQRQRNSENSRHDPHRKPASVENPKDRKETRIVKDNAEAGGAALQKKSVDQAADVDRNSSGVANQSLSKGSKNTEVVTEKLQSELSPEVCEKDLNEANQDILALNGNATPVLNEAALALLGTPVSVAITPVLAAASATELVQSLSTGTETFASTPVVLSLSSAESSKEISAVNAPSDSIDANASLNTTSAMLGVIEGESVVNQVAAPILEAQVVAENIGGLVGRKPTTDSDLSELNALQQPIASSQTVSANQLVNTVEAVDTPVLAAGAMTSLLPVKPAQGAVSNEPEQTAEILAVLTPDINLSAKLTAQASAPIDATLDSSNPATTTQGQIQAAKSAFEKTLQTIVSPDASGVDDSAAPALSSSSSSSSTNTLMDALMRGADQQTPAARSFVVQTAVPVPVGQPQWSQAVGEKVLWLAAQNVSSAEINLHPKDLGPIQVKVSVNQEQATVSFTSQHAVVREVLDQSLNRLREMFSEQGLNLVNVDVSDKSFSRQQGDAQDQKAQGGSNDVAQEEETPIAMSAIVQQRLVDHYA